MGFAGRELAEDCRSLRAELHREWMLHLDGAAPAYRRDDGRSRHAGPWAATDRSARPQFPGTIDATVNDGVVSLTGRAGWHHQRDEAAFFAGNVRRVFDVENQVVLTTPNVGPADIDDAYRRRARM